MSDNTSTDQGGMETPFGPINDLYCRVCGLDMYNPDTNTVDIGLHLSMHGRRYLLCVECLFRGVQFAAEESYKKALKEDRT